MSITNNDFIECEAFFLQSLPTLLNQSSGSLGDITLTETPSQKLELLCLFLDLVGTECIGEINTLKDTTKQVSNPTCVNLQE